MEDSPHLALLISTAMVGLTALVSLRVYFIRAPVPLQRLSHLWLLWFAIELVGLFMMVESEVWRDQNLDGGSLDDTDTRSNVWMYNLFMFFYFFYLARIYFDILETEWICNIIQVFYGAFIVFALVNGLFWQGLFVFQSFTYVVGGVFIIFLAGAYFWQLLISTDNQWITRDPFFWLSFALLVSLGGSVPFWAMFNYLEENHYQITVLYHRYISNGFTIFLNVLVIIAFLCRKNYPNPK